MSNSVGVTKVDYKNFTVTFKMLNELGKQNAVPEVLSHSIKIHPWTKIKELKQKIANVYGINAKFVRLFFPGFELSDKLNLGDYKILESRKPEILYKIDNRQNDQSIKVFGTFPCHVALEKIIDEIRNGFLVGIKPLQNEDGTSGMYKLRDVNKDTVAIFKPFDEEAFAPNNPKNYVASFGSPSFRAGVLSGEASIREVAAFLIDKNNAFEVPPTTFVEIAHKSFTNKSQMDEIINGKIMHTYLIENILCGKEHSKKMRKKFLSTNSNSETENNRKLSCSETSESESEHLDYIKTKENTYIPRKYGSLQKFQRSTDCAANLSFSLYTKDEVHKIAILDFRILNCDRNEENILVLKKKNKETKKNYYKLYPIDHALSFPDCLKIFDYEICWMGWDQAGEPFSENTRNYILNINVLDDMKRLSKVIKLRENCWKYLRVSNIVLQMGAKYNLTPLEIGNLLYQTDYKTEAPSKVAVLVDKTDNLCNHIKVDKRFRVFSENGEKRENKFDRRRSLLKQTTSAPKYKDDEDDELEVKAKKKEEDDEYKGLKSNKIDKIDKEEQKGIENIFNSPYYDIYFDHFSAFLKELIKKEYPDKFQKEERKCNKAFLDQINIAV